MQASAAAPRLFAPRSFVDSYIRPRIASDKALYDPQKGHAAYVFVMELASGLFALLLDLPYNALTGSVNALYDGLRRRKFSADYFYQHFNLAWRSSSTALRTLLLQPLWGRTNFARQLPCARELGVTFKKEGALAELLHNYQEAATALPLDSLLKRERLLELVDQVADRLLKHSEEVSETHLNSLAAHFKKIVPEKAVWAKHFAPLARFCCLHAYHKNTKKQLHAVWVRGFLEEALQSSFTENLALLLRQPRPAIRSLEDADDWYASWLCARELRNEQSFGATEIFKEAFWLNIQLQLQLVAKRFAKTFLFGSFFARALQVFKRLSKEDAYELEACEPEVWQRVVKAWLYHYLTQLPQAHAKEQIFARLLLLFFFPDSERGNFWDFRNVYISPEMLKAHADEQMIASLAASNQQMKQVRKGAAKK